MLMHFDDVVYDFFELFEHYRFVTSFVLIDLPWHYQVPMGPGVYYGPGCVLYGTYLSFVVSISVVLVGMAKWGIYLI